MSKQVSAHEVFPDFPLADLHAHLGASISPDVLWQLAHSSGFKLPKRHFEDFRDYITLSQKRTVALDDYFSRIYHPLLDQLSSGGQAVEEATYQTMAGAYRRSNITLMELRNNPMKHNKRGEFDLDHLILSMLRGMERALLECDGLSAGLIFCMGRDLSLEQNRIILDKAIKYRRRGVVGIDVAGPASDNFHYKDYAPLFARARRASLQVTVHSGENDDANDMWEALRYARPDRIGHGIKAAYDEQLMAELVHRQVVLEVCPLSNLATKAVQNIDEMKHIVRTLVTARVPFCINTDWPEVIEGCRLRNQFALLEREKLLSRSELRTCNRTAFAASFVPKPGGLEAYL